MEGVKHGQMPGLLEPVERSTFWERFQTCLNSTTMSFSGV